MDFIPITEDDITSMLGVLGLKSIEQLFNLSIPEDVRLGRPLDIAGGLSEAELTEELKKLSKQNASLDDHPSFLGAGAYDHFVPKIVDFVTSLPEYYTPYTPYQPEISQGILQALFEYQTMICELTGLEVANASLYDGSTAIAEAALLAVDVSHKNEILVSAAVHPEYLSVLRSYTAGINARIRVVPEKEARTDIEALKNALNENTACVVIQQPNFFGCLEDTIGIGEAMKQSQGLFIVSADPISLGILKPPALYGADVVVGEGQPLGNKLNFGGPYLGIFACRQDFIRRVPGHLISRATDEQGRVGYVQTLQTREQHIRRERATSNICTSEILNAVAATVYLSYLGPQGIREVANQCLQKAHYAFDKLKTLDYLEPLSNAPFFKEFTFRSKRPVAYINERLFNEGIIGGLDLGRFGDEYRDMILFCVTENHTRAEIDRLVDVMRAL